MTEEKQNINTKIKIWVHSFLFFLICFFCHTLLYQWFWMNDPIFTDFNNKGTFFMRAGALASILLVVIDLILITSLNKKFIEDANKTNSKGTEDYMKYNVIASNIKWTSGFFLLFNTFIWGFGDFIFINFK